MENKEKDLPKVKEKKMQEYKFLKKHTLDRTYYPSEKVSLDPKDKATGQLLTDKIIK